MSYLIKSSQHHALSSLGEQEARQEHRIQLCKVCWHLAHHHSCFVVFFFLFSILRIPILLSNTSLLGTSPPLPIFFLLIFFVISFEDMTNSNMVQDEQRADTSKCLLFSFSCLLFWNMAIGQIHNLFLQADISQVLHFHFWFLGFVLVWLWWQTNHSSLSFLCQYIFTRL